MEREREGARRWLLVAVLLLAFGLRLYRLGSESLWYDETVSVQLASKSIPALWEHTAGDIHPPGYYLLLHTWMRMTSGPELAGRDFAAAFFSVLFGMLLVALAYRLARRTFGQLAGALAALLVAVSPYNLWYSQEVRMYTLGATLAIVSVGAVLALVTNCSWRSFGDRGACWRMLALYAGTSALGLWVLYYFSFLLVSVNLLVAGWWLAAWIRNRAPRRTLGAWLGRWTLGQIAVVLLYLPWIPIAWKQATSPPVPPWRGFTSLGRVVVDTWSALSLGQSVEAAKMWPVLLLVAGIFAAGLAGRRGLSGWSGQGGRARGWRNHRPNGRKQEGGAQNSGSSRGEERAVSWILAATVFLPVALIYLASFVTPLYHVRYAFTYSTPFYIILGVGLAALGRRWRALLWSALVVILVFSGISIRAARSDPMLASDDHRAAVGFLADRWRPGDAILVNAGYVYTALEAYWRGDSPAWRGRLVTGSAPGYDGLARGGPVLALTGTVDGDPDLGWGDPGSDFYAMPWQETEAALERLFADYQRVWVYRCYDTVTDTEGAIRAWLAEHGTPFEDQVFTGEAQLRVQGYLTGRDPFGAALALSGGSLDVQPADWWLDDGSLRLAGLGRDANAVAVGGSLDLALVWEVARPFGAPDAVLFAGLFDADGERWAQVDQSALGSLLPPSSWAAGDLVRTPLRMTVPAGTPPGRYRLELGWYRFADGLPQWLPWTTGERVDLGEIEVTAAADWWALGVPEPDLEIGVKMGSGVLLLGLDASRLDAIPGETFSLVLYWRALKDGPEPGPAVLQLTDDERTVLLEEGSAPGGGRAPFSTLAAGQLVRDPRTVTVPGGLEAGVYDLSVGRAGLDGAWLQARRGPFRLGTHIPLVTIRVLDRTPDLNPPVVEVPVEARFGDSIELAGVDLEPGLVVAHWQALAQMDARYKIFLHVVGSGGAEDIRAQADLFPHLPTTTWQPGEHLRDSIAYDLPPSCHTGDCTLLLGLYDEVTGVRLPVFDTEGRPMGDSVTLRPAGVVPY